MFCACSQEHMHTGMQGTVCDLRGCAVCTGCALGSMCTQENSILCVAPGGCVRRAAWSCVCPQGLCIGMQGMGKEA